MHVLSYRNVFEWKLTLWSAFNLYRLIKGDGEIVEEIVSKDRHRAINKVKPRFALLRDKKIDTLILLLI